MTYCPRCLKQYQHPLPLNHSHTCTPHPAAEELDRLRAENERLRKIAAHVPAKTYISAKESAGYGQALEGK